MNNALVEEFAQAFKEAENDDEVRALILTGEGNKAFMAADIKEVQARDFVLGRKRTRRRQEVMRHAV